MQQSLEQWLDLELIRYNCVSCASELNRNIINNQTCAYHQKTNNNIKNSSDRPIKVSLLVTDKHVSLCDSNNSNLIIRIDSGDGVVQNADFIKCNLNFHNKKTSLEPSHLLYQSLDNAKVPNAKGYDLALNHERSFVRKFNLLYFKQADWRNIKARVNFIKDLFAKKNSLLSELTNCYEKLIRSKLFNKIATNLRCLPIKYRGQTYYMKILLRIARFASNNQTFINIDEHLACKLLRKLVHLKKTHVYKFSDEHESLFFYLFISNVVTKLFYVLVTADYRTVFIPKFFLKSDPAKIVDSEFYTPRYLYKPTSDCAYLKKKIAYRLNIQSILRLGSNLSNYIANAAYVELVYKTVKFLYKKSQVFSHYSIHNLHNSDNLSNRIQQDLQESIRKLRRNKAPHNITGLVKRSNVNTIALLIVTDLHNCFGNVPINSITMLNSYVPFSDFLAIKAALTIYRKSTIEIKTIYILTIDEFIELIRDQTNVVKVEVCITEVITLNTYDTLLQARKLLHILSNSDKLLPGDRLSNILCHVYHYDHDYQLKNTLSAIFDDCHIYRYIDDILVTIVIKNFDKVKINSEFSTAALSNVDQATTVTNMQLKNDSNSICAIISTVLKEITDSYKTPVNIDKSECLLVTPNGSYNIRNPLLSDIYFLKKKIKSRII